MNTAIGYMNQQRQGIQFININNHIEWEYTPTPMKLKDTFLAVVKPERSVIKYTFIYVEDSQYSQEEKTDKYS